MFALRGGELDPLHFACRGSITLASCPVIVRELHLETQTTARHHDSSFDARIPYCVFDVSTSAMLVATARHMSHVLESTAVTCEPLTNDAGGCIFTNAAKMHMHKTWIEL